MRIAPNVAGNVTVQQVLELTPMTKSFQQLGEEFIKKQKLDKDTVDGGYYGSAGYVVEKTTYELRQFAQFLDERECEACGGEFTNHQLCKEKLKDWKPPQPKEDDMKRNWV